MVPSVIYFLMLTQSRAFGTSQPARETGSYPAHLGTRTHTGSPLSPPPPSSLSPLGSLASREMSQLGQKGGVFTALADG